VNTRARVRSWWPGLLGSAFLLAASSADAGGPASFMTHHDTIPNFAHSHTIVSVRDGAWSSPSTWSPARVPAVGDVVSIPHTVLYDSVTGDVDTIGIEAGGTLRFSTSLDTTLRVATLVVMPDGTLEIGTPAAPVEDSATAQLVIRNKPLNPTSDPNQYGTGLLSVDGRVTVQGAVKSPTFGRLARAPRAGDTTFALEQPAGGWRVGDTLVLPDSRQVPTESGSGSRNTAERLEVRSIQAIAADGRTITFSPALQFDHPGTTDENGDGRPDYLPHVANLTRNVRVRSESRTGTRGHVLFTQRAAIDIRYAAFVDLGRTTFNDLDAATNHIGRYSLHVHHLMGPLPTVDPEYQFRLVGNAVYEDSPSTPPQKWGITIHGSHHGLVQDNVVYNVGGAGIVTEDGSESDNVFDHNFVVRVTSNGGRDEHLDASRGIAREGVGFWFRGPNNYVRNNVAANMGESVSDIEASYGFKFNMIQLGNVRIPSFRGADTFAAGQFTTVSGNAMGLREFANNEAYGQIQGLTLWWLCSVDFNAVANCPQSILRDTVIWHASRYAFYGYPASNYVFQNLKVYGDPAIASGNNHEFKSVFFFGDYGTTDLLVTNASFYNTVGLNPPYFRNGSIRVEDSFFKTTGGIIHRKSGAPGSCPFCDLPDPDTVVRRNRFAAVTGRPLRTLSLDDTSTDPANNDRLLVCDHNGQAGDHFEVFFPSQGNAPCTTTRPDVADGYVCVTARASSVCGAPPPPTNTPPAAPPGLRVR
jgi:hypothetical protein